MFTQNGGMLLIQSGNGGNAIAIADDGSGLAHNIKVKCGNGSTFTSGTTPVTQILVQSGRGLDRITYNLNGDTSALLAVNVQLGRGRDSFTAHLNGHQLLTGADYSFNVRGGTGSDDVAVAADDNVHIAVGASLTVNEQGGRGRDHLFASYNGKLEGRLSIDLSGGRGMNLVDSEVDLQAGSTGTVHNAVHGGGVFV
jgi:hypothetical protein